MSTASTPASPAPARKSSLATKLAIVAASFLVLVVVAYFAATSAWFLKSFVLPRAGEALNATVTVEDASISPFSAVTLTRLSVAAKGAEPFLTAAEVRLRYSLMDIIGGRLNIGEVAVISPVVQVTYAADGTSNLDPILKKLQAAPATKPAPATTPSKTPQLDLRKVLLQDATVRHTQVLKTGGRQLTEITGLTLTLDDLANGRAGKLALKAAIKFDQGLGGPTNGVLAATLSGNLDLSLDASLAPAGVKGAFELQTPQAAGAFKDIAGLSVILDADASPRDIKSLRVRLAQAGKSLGFLQVAGPFDAAKKEARLSVELAGIDRQALNIAGAFFGGDFNTTTLSSTNQIEITQGGKRIGVGGAIAVRQFSLTRQGKTTPVLDLGTSYSVAVDQDGKTALLQSLVLSATQSGRETVRGALGKPMTIAWGNPAAAVDESVFELTVNRLNLADWQAFAADLAPSGQLDARLNLVSRQAGHNLGIDLTARLDEFAARTPGVVVTNTGAELKLVASVQHFRSVVLSNLTATLAHRRAPLAEFAATGIVDAETQAATLDTSAALFLPAAAGFLANPDVKISQGAVKMRARFSQTNTVAAPKAPLFDRAIAGTLQLEPLTATVKTTSLDRFETAAQFDVALHGMAAKIQRLSATLRQAGQPGGSFDVTGICDTAATNIQLHIALAGLNENILRGPLAAALGSNQLRSAAINSTADIRLDPSGAAAVQAALSLTNLLVQDPAGRMPAQPLGFAAVLDATHARSILDLRKLELSLAPTARASNQMLLAGRVDMTISNAISGSLALTSAGLDFTHYYEMFMPPPSTNAIPAPAPAPAPAPVEPAANVLPLRNFEFKTAITAIFLKDVVVSNIVETTRIDGGKITVDPCKLDFLGAPVSARALLNLGVPGWEYDVAFGANRIPVQPLVQLRGMPSQAGIQGFILANAAIKGAGITPASVQKNLSGTFDFALTNAVVQLAADDAINQTKGMLPTIFGSVGTVLKPIATALGVPDVMQSPLTLIAAQGDIAKGVVTLKKAGAESSVFRAGTSGALTLGDPYTNTRLENLPIDIALERSAAIKARLASASTPTNQTFVALPSFVTVGGTVAKQDIHINKTVIAGLIGKSLIGVVPQVGGAAGEALRGVTGFLTGEKSTNAAGSNTTSGGLLKSLGGFLGGSAPETNAPGATNAPARKRGLFDLLK